MSKFDREEIIIKYAASVSGVEAATGAAAITALPYAATKLAPRLIPALIGRIGTGALAGSVVPGAGTLVGAVVGALGALWTAYDVYKAFTQKNIDDLIERIGALDIDKNEDPGIYALLNDENGEWIQKLKWFKTQMSSGKPSVDPGERVKDLDRRYTALRQYNAFLSEMAQLWSSDIKGKTKDWGFDPMSFERALKNAMTEAQTSLADVTAKLKQAGQTLLAQVGQQKGIDVASLSREIVMLYNEITASGRKLEMDPTEKQVFDMAKGLLEDKYNADQINKYVPHLTALRDGLAEASRRVKSQRTSGEKYISKRALKLDGAPIQTKPSAPGQQARPISRQNAQIVTIIQESINYLNGVAKLGLARINIDGQYGTQTANNLIALMGKNSQLEEAIRRQTGFSAEEFKDMALVSKNPDVLKSVARVLFDVVQYIRNQGQISGTTGGVSCDKNEVDPSDENIIACLKNSYVRAYNENLIAYQYLTSNHYDDARMVQLIKRLFPGAKPLDWSMPLLVQTIERQKRYGP